MVHSSLSRLGHVRGGASTVIEALLDAVGPNGTLVLPTHTWDRPGKGDFSFDVRRTQSCVGTISEHFRGWPGARRSLHPTHSVAAVGRLANEITADHERAATPCGDGTPYARLVDLDADVLFLACDLDSNTLFHTFEAQAGVAYLLRPAPEEFDIVNDAGVSTRARFLRHERGPARRFGDVEDDLIDAGALRRGDIGRSSSRLVDTRRMATYVLDRLAKDPTYLLSA
jgi:aminoglycoside 3-N-acetyltransferase